MRRLGSSPARVQVGKRLHSGPCALSAGIRDAEQQFPPWRISVAFACSNACRAMTALDIPSTNCTPVGDLVAGLTHGCIPVCLPACLPARLPARPPARLPARPLLACLHCRDASGKPMLLTANAGDARVLLARGGTALQLTEDHVPDKWVRLGS